MPPWSGRWLEAACRPHLCTKSVHGKAKSGSSLLAEDKHCGIERRCVASKFAVHFAGEVHAADEMLAEGVADTAEKHGLIAKRKWRGRADSVPPSDEEQIGAGKITRIGTGVGVKNHLMTPLGC